MHLIHTEQGGRLFADDVNDCGSLQTNATEPVPVGSLHAKGWPNAVSKKITAIETQGNVIALFGRVMCKELSKNPIGDGGKCEQNLTGRIVVGNGYQRSPRSNTKKW